MNLKELSEKPEKINPGHRSCAGCAFPIIMRNILRASEDPVVVCAATGCMEVTTTIYPYTSWNVPFIHSAFENAGATISGIETAYRALKKNGKIKKKINFVAFGGDGGTYDIGLQSLSGALERGHNFLYVCYDNEAYMNTGIQRSSATPYGASTTTSPAGKKSFGKKEYRKNITEIVAAHNIPYAAQAAVHDWNDLINKAKKAFSKKGPAFINVFSPCPVGWKHKYDMSIDISKLAVKTNFWPLYEIEDGEYKLNYHNKNRIPIKKYLETQGRFKHLFKDENEEFIKRIQKHVDNEWDELLKKCGVKKN